MKKLFGNKKDGAGNDGIIVLKKTDPCECGGTDATLDTKAPKKIASKEMVLFDISSVLGRTILKSDCEAETIHAFSAFAAPCFGGSFLYLETVPQYGRSGGKNGEWALVSNNVFPELCALIDKYDVAERNGYHSKTHGLPENFGGEVDVRYASGERISFSDNQTPILKTDFGLAVVDLFRKAMRGDRIALPDVGLLREIRFEETRDNGGFTKAALTISPDGTGVNKKQSRYDNPTVYESEKPVDAETVSGIASEIEKNALLAWPGLPESGYSYGKNKTLTFVFDGGEERTFRGDRSVPIRLHNGFFNVELEMTVKH